MFECTLTKISREDIEGGPRTDKIGGMAELSPKIGHRFNMIGKSLSDFGENIFAVRYFETTELTDITEEGDKEWVVTTKSKSKYHIKFGDKITV